MDNEYYILENGERMGPFTAQELMDRPLEPDDVVLLPSQTQGIPAYEMPEFNEYFKSEGIYYPTKENTTSYMLRLPAFIIDYFIIIIAIMIVGMVLFPQYVLQLQKTYTPESFTYQGYLDNVMKHQNEALIMQLVLFVIIILYSAACEASRLQGSIGKYVLGLAVVDELGYRLTFWQALKRNLGKLIYEFVSFVMGPFAYLFYLRMIWGERHQAMHDQLAKCYIVKKSR
jgi:uncharacterized RDD family membrane protein YckC